MKYGVTGTSHTSYSIRGGGAVREGLVADAKKDLMSSHPLQENQAYANMTVDIITTEGGRRLGDTYTVDWIDLVCTVSADIIQYGKSSDMSDMTSQLVQSLEELEGSSLEGRRKEEEREPPKEFKEGDLIWYLWGYKAEGGSTDQGFPGEIIESKGTSWIIKYDKNGIVKTAKTSKSSRYLVHRVE